jgi:drug/metabolite transporter (DMT)-like permease
MASATTWAQLSDAARAFRVAHAVWSVLGLASLAYIWASAVRRRRNRRTLAAMAFLSVEGAALVIGRGNCPFGPFQRTLGDPVPLFELVLPPRAAKAAVPVLAAVSLAGFAAVLLRKSDFDMRSQLG